MPGADDENNNQPGADDKNKDQNQNPGGNGGGNNQGGDDELSLEDAKKIIKDLRKENANHRTKGKSQEDSLKSLGDQLASIKKHLNIKDDVDPAEQLKSLTEKSDNLELELTFTQLARQHSIPVENDEYFRFLMGKKLAGLKDDEELGDDAIAEVVAEVQKFGGFKQEKPNGNRSGVDEKGGKKPNGGGNEAMTPEEFAKLNFNEKTKLFTDNKPEYDRLWKSAKEKRLI